MYQTLGIQHGKGQVPALLQFPSMWGDSNKQMNKAMSDKGLRKQMSSQGGTGNLVQVRQSGLDFSEEIMFN